MEFVCHAEDLWNTMEPRWSAVLGELPDEPEDWSFDESLPAFDDDERLADFDGSLRAITR